MDDWRDWRQLASEQMAQTASLRYPRRWLAAPANIHSPFGAKGRFRDLLTLPVPYRLPSRINIIEPSSVNGMPVVALLRREAKCKNTRLKPVV
jgi:hypothetical protein